MHLVHIADDEGIQVVLMSLFFSSDPAATSPQAPPLHPPPSPHQHGAHRPATSISPDKKITTNITPLGELCCIYRPIVSSGCCSIILLLAILHRLKSKKTFKANYIQAMNYIYQRLILARVYLYIYITDTAYEQLKMG